MIKAKEKRREKDKIITCTSILGLWGDGKETLCMKWDMCLKINKDVCQNMKIYFMSEKSLNI